MMPTTQTQDKALSTIQRELGALLSSSEQAMYVFIDEDRKFCNENFAQLLGYASPEAWASANGGFTTAYVAADSRETIVHAFQDAIEHGVGTAIPVTWRSKDGLEVETDVLLVPVEIGGQRFALHFIEPVDEE